MFDSILIPNDLQMVDKAIRDYYDMTEKEISA
jgi:hypothetical protein